MPFRFDKFTIKAQEAVQGAVELAASRGNPQATPVHLLHALLAEREGIVRPLFQKIGVDIGHLERITEAVTRHAGLAIAGAAYQGVGIPQVIASGQAAAARISAASRPQR